MKRYDLRFEGEIQWNQSAHAVEQLFLQGRITCNTPCRLSGQPGWDDVAEYFPLLKYGRTLTQSDAPTSEPGFAFWHRRWPDLVGIGVIIICGGFLAILGMKLFSIHERRNAAAAASRLVHANPPSVNSSTDASPPMVISRQTARPAVFTGSTERKTRSISIPRTVPQQRAPAAPRRSEWEEVSIEYGKSQSVQTRFGSFRVAIFNHGVATFTVRFNGGGPRRIWKEKGFETDRTNIVEIGRVGSARVYYVDRISVKAGQCVLRVEKDA
jgi:hypothetical protein